MCRFEQVPLALFQYGSHWLLLNQLRGQFAKGLAPVNLVDFQCLQPHEIVSSKPNCPRS